MIGLVLKLCEFARDRYCVEVIGALRNLVINMSVVGVVGDVGVMEIFGDVICVCVKLKDSELSVDDR